MAGVGGPGQLVPQFFRQELGLIKTSLPLPFGVERDGYEQGCAAGLVRIEVGAASYFFGLFSHEIRENIGQFPDVVVFQGFNELGHQRLAVIAGGPEAAEMKSRRASRAELAVWFRPLAMRAIVIRWPQAAAASRAKPGAASAAPQTGGRKKQVNNKIAAGASDRDYSGKNHDLGWPFLF